MEGIDEKTLFLFLLISLPMTVLSQSATDVL